jgi:hypothetical protein
VNLYIADTSSSYRPCTSQLPFFFHRGAPETLRRWRISVPWYCSHFEYFEWLFALVCIERIFLVVQLRHIYECGDLVLSACHCLSVVLVIDHGNLIRADEQETGWVFDELWCLDLHRFAASWQMSSPNFAHHSKRLPRLRLDHSDEILMSAQRHPNLGKSMQPRDDIYRYVSLSLIYI